MENEIGGERGLERGSRDGREKGSYERIEIIEEFKCKKSKKGKVRREV